MNPTVYDDLEKTLNAAGPAAAVERLCAKLREENDYHNLFYALLLRKRHELGVSPIPTGPSADLPDAAVTPYEDGIRAPARQVGGLFPAAHDPRRCFETAGRRPLAFRRRLLPHRQFAPPPRGAADHPPAYVRRAYAGPRAVRLRPAPVEQVRRRRRPSVRGPVQGVRPVPDGAAGREHRAGAELFPQARPGGEPGGGRHLPGGSAGEPAPAARPAEGGVGRGSQTPRRRGQSAADVPRGRGTVPENGRLPDAR